MQGQSHCPAPCSAARNRIFPSPGLKSAVMRTKQSGQHEDADIAAAFQQAAIDCLIDRLQKSIDGHGTVPSLVVAGGVAANKAIRAALESFAGQHRMRFVAPPMALCTDNAAMIAWAGAETAFDEPVRPARFRREAALAARSRCRTGAWCRGESMSAVGVIGAGAWGTALAQMLASDGRDVIIWARETELVFEINTGHTNSIFLPDARLKKTIAATNDLSDLTGCSTILVVTPAQHLGSVLTAMPDFSGDLVLCSKGIEASNGRLMNDVAKDAAPGSNIAILSGPTFAHEVAAGHPTAVTLACSGGRKQWDRLKPVIARQQFRPYYSDDVIGAEIGGAVKNVLAIACGVVDGLGLGQNARAALIARGYAEMLRFGEALGAQRETLSGLCGLGDLVLTCSSTSSRNFSLGKSLGEGQDAKITNAGSQNRRRRSLYGASIAADGGGAEHNDANRRCSEQSDPRRAC